MIITLVSLFSWGLQWAIMEPNPICVRISLWFMNNNIKYGNKEDRAKTFPTFPIYTKCKEKREARRRLFFCLDSALNVGK